MTITIEPANPRLKVLLTKPLQRWLRPLIAVITAVIASIALASAGTADVTRPRIEDSLNPAFSNLYVQQQELLGHPGVTPASIRASTSCERGDASVPDVGPGSDWICMVDFIDNTGAQQSGKFELQVHANSCYTANGPAKLLGSFTIPDTTGREVPNPVNAFDVCFDPDA